MLGQTRKAVGLKQRKRMCRVGQRMGYREVAKKGKKVKICWAKKRNAVERKKINQRQAFHQGLSK